MGGGNSAIAAKAEVGAREATAPPATPRKTHQPVTAEALVPLPRFRPPETHLAWREFYLNIAVQEKWSKRELERQYDTVLFERVVLAPAKISPVLAQSHPGAASIFKETYLVEFLDLPVGYPPPSSPTCTKPLRRAPPWMG